MIPERMLELLLLTKFRNIVNFKGKELDRKRMNKRYIILLEEFLEPYVIDSTSKE